MNNTILEAVRHCYWEKDVNCARTTLYTLARLAGFALEPQVWAAATGMHGAGRFGAQCGLVEGTLMFIGIQGTRHGLPDQRVGILCHAYATAFARRFGSLECRVLRPNGFRKEDPPHACEELTLKSLRFAVDFLAAQRELCFPAAPLPDASPVQSPPRSPDC